MKYIIITLILITSLKINAQKTATNFILEEGKVSWKKVYNTKKSNEEIISHFKESGLFKLFRVEDGKIVATMRPQSVDQTKTGVAGIPPIVIKTDFMGTVIIGMKEGRYRVSFQDILLVGKGDIIKNGEKQPFELHYVTKDGTDYRKYFHDKPEAIYNDHFNELFRIEIEEPKDDW